jgi:hypothetical protein
MRSTISVALVAVDCATGYVRRYQKQHVGAGGKAVVCTAETYFENWMNPITKRSNPLPPDMIELLEKFRRVGHEVIT